MRSPSSTSTSPSMRWGVSGWANPHDGHEKRSSVQSSNAAERGQVAASLRHGAPSAIQVGSAGSAAHTTCGSDALAITRSFGRVVHTSRHCSAIARTSPNRSSWSRVRLPSTSSSASSGSTTFGSQRSSTSMIATGAARSRPSAAAMPAGMFAPVWLVTTSVPAARSASASRRVVVVLPFVADTSATRRAPTTSSSRSGRMASITRPLTCVPAPRPVTRDAQPAARPAVSASLARVPVTAARTSRRRPGRESRCGPGLRRAGACRARPGSRRARAPARRVRARRCGSPSGTGPGPGRG